MTPLKRDEKGRFISDGLICQKCGNEKIFYAGQLRCRSCHLVYMKAWNKNLHKEVMDAYGGVCQCCGESRLEFLALDHIDGDGAKERREIGSSYAIYLHLRNNDWPEGYRTLCHNCNHSYGHYDYCPHGEI